MEKSKKQFQEIKKYDLVFIGGGPATLSFMAYLFQNRKSERFLNSNILIIEKKPNFGSGCLGDYGINTNTSGEGFPRLLYSYEKKKEENNNFKKENKETNILLVNRNEKKEKKQKIEKSLEVDTSTLTYKLISIFSELNNTSSVKGLINSSGNYK